MIYDCDFFIKKFEAIPEELWCTDFYEDKLGRKCSLGQCGSHGEESDALRNLFGEGKLVAFINDGLYPNYPQPTPKQRILAALYDIKKMQERDKIPAKPVEQLSITPAPPRIVYVAIDAEVKKLGEEIVMS